MLSVAFCAEYRNAWMQKVLISTSGGDVRTCEISCLRRIRAEALAWILLPLLRNPTVIAHDPTCALT